MLATVHIIPSTPTGEAQLKQQLVLPTAILLACRPQSTVAEVRTALYSYGPI